jgi:alginate O-acetyltransferase complex protein AlgI
VVFASLTFLYLFLPLNLLLYYMWGNKAYRNALLTLFSFLFYAWGEPVWITLLIFSASIDYVHGLLVEKYRNTKWKRAPVISSLVLNLGLLAAFKYSGFITENMNALLGTNFPVPDFALPIGISFYTFQTISYVIDVYRGEVKAQRSFLNFMLFVSLFHQLVAGPIVRYQHIANEIDNRKLWLSDISAGITRFCIGLFKKVAIANVAGELVNTYLAGDLSQITVTEAWFGLLMFSIQIYFDFSGYSDMAIGLGRMFGFHYHENFMYPYISSSATDFWRRWHISLGTFFRDYVYIPLGGKTKFAYRNLLIVWFLTGLWHGASWNYIFWGLFWGALILIERLFLKRFFDAIPRLFSHLYLLFAALLGWALFYFEDLTRLGHFFRILFGASGQPNHAPEFELVFMENVYWLGLALLLCLPLFPLTKQAIARGPQFAKPLIPYAAAVFSLGLLFIATAMLAGNSYNPFLYFRF